MAHKNPNENLVCIGGIWKARWWINGVATTKTLGTRNVKEARAKVKVIMAEVEARRHGVAVTEPTLRPRYGWDDAVGAYKSSEGWRSIAEPTRKRYEIDIARIGRFLAENDVMPDEANLSTVTAFISDMRDDEKSSSSIKNALTAWSRVSEGGIAAGKLDTNPVKAYERRQLGGSALMAPPLNGEFARILPDVRAWNPAMALFAEFLFLTGCRVGEALLANREDITDGERLYLHRGVKRSRPRSVYLNNAEDLLPLLPKAGRLFPDLDERVAVVSTQWGKFWRQRAEPELARVQAQRDFMPPGTPEHRMPRPDPWLMRRWRLHDHRHAFAIEAILAKAAIGDLSRHLGHRSVKTTEGYLEAMEQLPVEMRGGMRLTKTAPAGKLNGMIEERITSKMVREVEFDTYPDEVISVQQEFRPGAGTVSPTRRKRRLRL